MGQKKTTIQTGTWSPTWGYSLEASASMAQYPTTDNKRIGTNYWVVVDGKSQMNSATRNGNDSTTNVSESMAFATKYPTNTNRTNKGTTYGYPSTTVQRPMGLYVQYPFETNSGSAAYNAPLYDNGVLISSSKQANELRYPNNTTKAGWVDDISPKNQ